MVTHEGGSVTTFHLYIHTITVCQGEELLSTNRSLLPLSSITASSEDSSPAQNVVDSSVTGWCSTEDFNDALASPYIIFNFTERVTLTYMRARGGLGALGFAIMAYVTEFELDYRDEYDGSYTPYIHLNEQVSVHIDMSFYL